MSLSSDDKLIEPVSSFDTPSGENLLNEKKREIRDMKFSAVYFLLLAIGFVIAAVLFLTSSSNTKKDRVENTFKGTFMLFPATFFTGLFIYTLYKIRYLQK